MELEALIKSKKEEFLHEWDYLNKTPFSTTFSATIDDKGYYQGIATQIWQFIEQAMHEAANPVEGLSTNKPLTDDVERAIKDVVWMARRYANGRRTYAPQLFNLSYDILVNHIEFDHDADSEKKEEFPDYPYATDGSNLTKPEE